MFVYASLPELPLYPVENTLLAKPTTIPDEFTLPDESIDTAVFPLVGSWISETFSMLLIGQSP